jgi:membrane protease YdiL (CAAX protease family)
MTSRDESREHPYWSYEDLALFLGAVLPCLGVAALAVRLVRLPTEGVKAVTLQFLFEALLLAALYLLIARRYGRPFWSSLGWTFEYRGAWLCLIAGPVLTIALGFLGVALHAPNTSAIRSLMTDRLSQSFVILFGTLAGPVFEELVFRGFLLPLFARSMGSWPAVLLTAAMFALLHIEYRGSWQAILIVGLAGIVFGFVRIKTGSTAASAVVHVGYNATLFAIYLAQQNL